MDLALVADRLNRTVKLALDTGEASSVEEAEQIFAGYRLQIVLGSDVAQKPVLQAALLTAVNCAARTLLGGVTVFGASGELKVTLPRYRSLEQALVGLGAVLVSKIEPDVPTLVVGDFDGAEIEPRAIRATFSGWCGGVVPMSSGLRLAEMGAFTPAGVLAGALAVSEVFQRLRGSQPSASRRSIGLDLWQPERDWLKAGSAPELERLPASAWLVGMGNLGQAYLWALGLLPYSDKSAELVLQDFDILAPSNLSTSLLSTPDRIGWRKTRAMAAWAEKRGFKTSIVERKFGANFQLTPEEPSVALIGVDNALARQTIEDAGFERVIEAGLGAGTQDYLGIDLHTFPASRPAREIWTETETAGAEISQPAYKALLAQSKDPCGTIRLAGRSIGAPFVGATAASLVIAELARLAAGGPRYELISCHLRDLQRRFVSKGSDWPAFNPGSIRLVA